MGKKNKKNTKINQRIRIFFDNDPFDVGVERVSSETLSELFSTLGIYDVEHSKDVLLKTVRMLWSEADSDFRQDILNFFTANDVIYPSGRPKEPTPDKDHKLKSLISELNPSHEEEVLLLDSFSNVRSKKITIQKIESKLKHIRYDLKKAKLEKELDGIFDIDNSLEFNASLRYRIFKQHFHKILTLNTKPYSYEYIDSNSIEEIIHKISLDKEKVIQLISINL